MLCLASALLGEEEENFSLWFSGSCAMRCAEMLVQSVLLWQRALCPSALRDSSQGLFPSWLRESAGPRGSGAGRREGQNPDARDGFAQVGLPGWAHPSAFRFRVVERDECSWN